MGIKYPVNPADIIGPVLLWDFSETVLLQIFFH